MGNRVCKKTTEGENVTERKYLVDIAGGLSTIIGEIEADSSSPDYGSLKKSYIYADGQILSQRAFGLTIVDFLLIIEWTPSAGDFIPPPRFAVLAFLQGESFDGTTAEAVNSYTYTPFGQVYDGQLVETVENPWQFTGQWYDDEIDQYHLRARQYDPVMMRFTSRDPATGRFTEPATLHKYLYCWNNPVNLVDLNGEHPMLLGMLAGGVLGYFQGLTAWGAFEADLAMRGIELSPEERGKRMQAFILGGITLGAVAGGVTTLTGGLDAAMTFSLINRLVMSIASGVFAAEHYAYHSKGADPKGKAEAIHIVSNTRLAAINAFIDINF